MKGYLVVRGDYDGEVIPILCEGIFLKKEKAFKVQVKLNKLALTTLFSPFYEEGYGEDFFPETDKEMAKAWEDEDWDYYNELLDKHCITDPIELSKKINELDYTPYGFYSIEPIIIKE